MHSISINFLSLQSLPELWNIHMHMYYIINNMYFHIYFIAREKDLHYE